MTDENDYLVEDYFEIKIDFSPNQGDPSRVFTAMAELLEAFQALDRDLLGQFAIELKSELVLDDIQKGSLKSILRNIVIDVPDDALKNSEWKKILGHYLLKSKYAILNWTEEHDQIETRKDLEPIEGELVRAAEETDIQRIPAYQPMPTSRLLNNIRDISSAARKLDAEESATFTSSHGTVKINGKLAISDEAIRDILTSSVEESLAEQTLQVKKPDYLGHSMWTFRYSGHGIEAKIIDEDWLNDFHNSRVILQPGDALRVRLKEEFYYGHMGEIVSVHYEVVEVLRVIRSREQQTTMDI